MNGANAGLASVNGSGFRGDIFMSTGTCRSRYGLVIDARTLLAVSGATVQLNNGRPTTTGADGWYRIDGDCPAELGIGTVDVSTTDITVTHQIIRCAGRSWDVVSSACCGSTWTSRVSSSCDTRSKVRQFWPSSHVPRCGGEIILGPVLPGRPEPNQFRSNPGVPPRILLLQWLHRPAAKVSDPQSDRGRTALSCLA